MQLGAFSTSLAVKDIQSSKDFYEKLGFEIFIGNIDEKWLIMKNEDCVIGLFQGMFEKNILSFNPGWNKNAEKLDSYTDIRVLQNTMEGKGINIDTRINENTTGSGSFMITDPDGNTILFDQHV